MGTCVPYGDRTQKIKITESEDVLQSEGMVWEKSSSKSAVMGFSRCFKEGDVSVLVGIAYIVDNECKLMEGPLKAWIHDCVCVCVVCQEKGGWAEMMSSPSGKSKSGERMVKCS